MVCDLSNGTYITDFEQPWRSLLLFENILIPITREIQRVLTTYLHMNQKVHVACNFNCVLKLKDFSRSQAVTFTAEVVVSRKPCKIKTPFLMAIK